MTDTGTLPLDTPELAVGDVVTFTIGAGRQDTGRIVAIHTETTEYAVQTAAQRASYERETNPRSREANLKSSGFLVPYEAAKPATVNP